MAQLRREFLKSISLAPSAYPLLACLLEETLPAAALAQEPFDQSTYNFWTSQVRQPSDKFAKGLNAKGATFEPEFIFCDPTAGFQRSDRIDDSKMPQSGSVNVTVQVQRFRPSQANAQAFSQMQSGSLRIDVKQTAPLPSLSEALAWTAMAAVVPKSGNQLPDLKDLSFDPGQSWGQLTQIPLTNGLGFWSWNFFLKKPQGFWGTFMEIFRTANKVVFPLLSLPGIATTALTSIDKMVGVLQAKGDSNWLFKSQDSPIYTTKEAKAKIGFGLPLKTGTYLILPKDAAQLAAFGSASPNLEVQGGYLVQKGTDQFQRESNAAQQIPTVDYMIADAIVSTAPADNKPVTNTGTKQNQ